jgi:intracellular septation protein A
MPLWTYRLPFFADGEKFLLETKVHLRHMESCLCMGPQVLARDSTRHWSPDGLTRWHRLSARIDHLGVLEVEVGYVNAWSIGIRVMLNGRLIHESHPGNAFLKGANASRLELEPIFSKHAIDTEASRKRWQRNQYSIYTDVSLAILFFITVKVTADLPTAAIITALAGLGVALAQRIMRIDFLGGLAVFGVFMLLISAGFSMLFQDDSIVQMKSTFLGLFVAALMLGDVLFNRGQYFGTRISRYLPGPLNAYRLTLGMATLGVTMATLNYIVARTFSSELWLYYTTFGDFLISLILLIGIFRFARLREGEIHADET